MLNHYTRAYLTTIREHAELLYAFCDFHGFANQLAMLNLVMLITLRLVVPQVFASVVLATAEQSPDAVIKHEEKRVSLA